jgi:hypothetical protein
MSDTNRNTGNRPNQSSITKIAKERAVAALDAAVPQTEVDGVSVAAWREVMVTVHPNTPLLSAAPAGWQITVRPWFFRYSAIGGQGSPAGQWFSGEEFTVGMDGDPAQGPMQQSLDTETADRLLLQVVDDIGPPAAFDIRIGVYGLTPYGDSRVGAAGGGGAPGPPGPGVVAVRNLFDLMAHEDYTYCNLRGDFTAVRQAANTFTLTGLNFAVSEEQILAVGYKEPGAVSPTQMYYRDLDLECDWTAGSSRITINNFAVVAGDIFIIYLEGPSKTLDVNNYARRTKSANPDSKFVATDGEILDDITLVAQEADNFYPYNMAQDGYYYLKAKWLIGGTANLRLQATDDLGRDGNEVWVDITQETFGLDVLDVNSPDTIPIQSYVGHRRIRWVTSDPSDGGTISLYQTRSAYGDIWTPQAIQGLPAQAYGPQTMGIAEAVQPAAVTALDAVREANNLYGERILASYIWANQADRTEEDDPLDTRDTGDILADDLDLPQATTHDYYLTLQHYKGFSLQFIPDPDGGSPDGNTELSVFASNEDNGTAPNALDYTDVTLDWFGAAVIVAEDFLLFDTEMCAYYIHIQVARGAGVGTEDYTLFARRNF